MHGMNTTTAKLIQLILAVSLFLAFFATANAKEIANLDSEIEKARNGNSDAQSNLIDYYYNNKRDYQQTVNWCNVILNNPNSNEIEREYGARILGVCYFNGTGVDRSIDKAISTLKIGADVKNGRCAFILAKIYRDELNDYTSALNWFKKSADLGGADAAMFLGKLYENGFYSGNKNEKLQFPNVTQDLNLAANYYRIYLSKTGVNTWHEFLNPPLAYKVGTWYYNGDGNIEIDYPTACYLLEEAVKSDDEERVSKRLTDEEKGNAFWLLSVCYRFGRGVNADELKARRYVKRAAELGNPKALKTLE